MATFTQTPRMHNIKLRCTFYQRAVGKGEEATSAMREEETSLGGINFIRRFGVENSIPSNYRRGGGKRRKKKK